MANINYVKFLRGTPAAFEKIPHKDENTLYFISQSGADSGKLYLGAKLIAGGSDISQCSLGELKDIILKETIIDGSVLAYNALTGNWEDKPLEEIVVEIMTGATATEDGASGLVPAPHAGDQNKFLRGDGTWAEAGESVDVEILKAQVGTLIAGSWTETESPSIKEIAVKVLAEQLIPEHAKESLDTLKEIAAWIQQHPDDFAALNAQVQAQAQDIETLQGAVVTLGEGVETNAGNITILQSNVGQLQTDVLNLQVAHGSLQAEVTEINQRLTWVEMAEE